MFDVRRRANRSEVVCIGGQFGALVRHYSVRSQHRREPVEGLSVSLDLQQLLATHR